MEDELQLLSSFIVTHTKVQPCSSSCLLTSIQKDCSHTVQNISLVTVGDRSVGISKKPSFLCVLENTDAATGMTYFCFSF